jgi:hypothetical protein
MKIENFKWDEEKNKLLKKERGAEKPGSETYYFP